MKPFLKLTVASSDLDYVVASYVSANDIIAFRQVTDRIFSGDPLTFTRIQLSHDREVNVREEPELIAKALEKLYQEKL